MGNVAISIGLKDKLLGKCVSLSVPPAFSYLRNIFEYTAKSAVHNEIRFQFR